MKKTEWKHIWHRLHNSQFKTRCRPRCITTKYDHKEHTHTTVLLLVWNMSGSTRVSRYQKSKTKKVKTNLDLLEQEIVSGSGICWAICKSAPHSRQPRQHPTTQFFTSRMPFLPHNQQRQSAEANTKYCTWKDLQWGNDLQGHSWSLQHNCCY